MTSARPDVTAIVIAYEVRDEVMTCLASLERHADGLDVETILIDNGSQDGTVEAVRAHFPDTIVVALDHNAGLPARNEGLRRARGRYRMFIDTDAELTAGAMTTMVELLDSDPSIGLVGPRLVNEDGSLQLSCRRYPPVMLPVLRRPPLMRWFDDGPTIRHHLMADAPYDRRRRVEYVLGACMMFTERAQASAGEIDERIWFGHDDADWCFKIREAGLDIVFEPAATVIHRYRRTSVSNAISKHSIRQLQAHVHFQRKWARRRSALRAAGRAMDEEARIGRDAPIGVEAGA